MKNRATRIAQALLASFFTAALLAGCCPFCKKDYSAAELQPQFVHVVFFWLNDGTPEARKQQLIADCKDYLGTVKTVRRIEVGTPAGTPREVVDNSWDVAIVVYFEDGEGHDYYQKAEKHLEFIARNEDIWQRVQVYDMIPE